MGNIVLEKQEELDFEANEAYKVIRANIEFCGDDIKVLAFTSCSPNEGKSSVSFNLAISFAKKGKKVVLLDADLRKSVLIGRYRVGGVSAGLSHYLSGQNKLEEVLYHTNIENVDIIFSGSYAPNPTELLEHDRFQSLIEILREEYDYVIVDTPPLGTVIDSAIIAKYMDGVVLVIESNAISYRSVQRVKNQLEKSNCKILGAILNKVKSSQKTLSGYYKRYYR